MKTGSRRGLGCSVIIMLVLLFVFRKQLGITGINSFLFMDNLLHVNNEVQPAVMWAVFGLCIGAVYGSYTAWKKYRLSFKVNLIPIAVFLLLLVLLSAVSQPIQSSSLDASGRAADAYGLVTVQASSRLPDYNNNSYSEANLLDRDDHTAWIENNAYSGLGEHIDFIFSHSGMGSSGRLKCTGFRIKNGYNKSEKTWRDHNRLKTFSVYHNNNLVSNLPAGDYFDRWEEIRMKPLPVRSGDVISIYITSVYPGSKISSQTAISELVPIVE